MIVLTGDSLGIKQYIATIGSPIRFCPDITIELKQRKSSLFYTPAIVYFFADSDFIKANVKIEDNTIVAIVESVDKRLKFFKDNKTIVIKRPSLNKTIETIVGDADGATIDNTVEQIKRFSSNDSPMPAGIEEFNKYYKTYHKDMNIRDTEINSIVTKLYSIYYDFKEKAYNRQLAGHLINQIMTTKLIAINALQLYILKSK